MDERLIMVLVGTCAGIFSGVFGIGGGIIIVPILVSLFGLSQQTANGTSLVALLAPVGILGVMEYYRSGKLSPENIKMGMFIALGIFVGAFLGAKLAVHLSSDTLKKAFAIFLIFVAGRLWLS